MELTVKVMVVEDNDIVAQAIEAFLLINRHQVMGPYSTSADVFRAVQHERPDLVLMDIDLHGRSSGLDCARVLFKRYNIPVVFLSSDVTAARTGELVAVGALAKPVTGDTLLASLHAVEQIVEGKMPRHVPPAFTLYQQPGYH